MSLISIIIPVYNTEKYIRKCLDSIIVQTYTNWEAILVNDGSTDSSGAICDEYTNKDTRFKVIHKENGGVSSARQTGLENTTGDYVIHCDPDDWVEPDMLKEMLLCATAQDADMVICDFFEENKEKSVYCSQKLHNPTSAKEVQALIINDELHGSCCNKLIRKSCIEGIGFFPQNISLCEDELFNIRVLNKDLKVVYLPNAFYHYNFNNNSSICHSSNPAINLSRKLVIEECEKIINIENFNNLYAMKKSLLTFLFLAQNFDELKETYKEIHPLIIKNNSKYYFFTPLGFFLAKALKHSPKKYYRLYNINIFLISLIQKFRKMLTIKR